MAAKPLPEQTNTFDNQKLYVWVKSLESKVNNLLREVDVLKNNFIKKNNDLSRDLKTLSEDLLEVKHEREKNIRKMDLIIKELKQTAGKEEVMTLQKYLDLWNPMHFATQRDVEQLIDARLEVSESEKNKKEKNIDK